MKRIHIEVDEDTGLSNDDGPFCSYQLVASGDTLGGLVDGAWIFEIDQDGGEGRNYSIYDAREEVTLTCELMLTQAWANAYKIVS